MPSRSRPCTWRARILPEGSPTRRRARAGKPRLPGPLARAEAREAPPGPRAAAPEPRAAKAGAARRGVRAAPAVRTGAAPQEAPAARVQAARARSAAKAACPLPAAKAAIRTGLGAKRVSARRRVARLA